MRFSADRDVAALTGKAPGKTRAGRRRRGAGEPGQRLRGARQTAIAVRGARAMTSHGRCRSASRAAKARGRLRTSIRPFDSHCTSLSSVIT